MASGGSLLKRAKLLGLTKAGLARAARVDVQTVGHLGKDRPRGAVEQSLTKLSRVIEARELEVFDALLPQCLEARKDRVAELLRHKGFRLESDAA